jgi:hypothetical protein
LTVGRDGRAYIAYHAWNGEIGYRSGGRRSMHVEPIDFSSGAPVLANTPPTGSVDPPARIPGGVSVAGRAQDPDTARVIGVAVFLNGRVLSGLFADRPGHRFTTVLGLADGRHEVCVAARDDVQQSDPRLGCVTVDVGSRPSGAVDGLAPLGGDRYRVSGWALDPDAPAAVGVQVEIDGRYSASATAAGTRPDVASRWPGHGPAHGFVVDVTVPAGAQQVCVYAMDSIDDGPGAAIGCQQV